MNTATAKALSSMNTIFYEEVSASFSKTRSSAWPGWASLIDELKRAGCNLDGGDHRDIGVLDVACGNMRFERFLKEALPHQSISYIGIDNCTPLLDEGSSDRFVALDLIDLTVGVNTPSIPCEKSDLVTCFGFFHHIPGLENRKRFLDILSGCVKDESFLAISLWRFLEDNKLASKAEDTHQLGTELLQKLCGSPSELEKNDCFLPWQDAEGAVRYCHHFDDDEINELIEHASSQFELAARYFADGRSDALNCYLLFKKKGL